MDLWTLGSWLLNSFYVQRIVRCWVDGSKCGLGIHLKSTPWPASAKPSNPSSLRSVQYATRRWTYRRHFSHAYFMPMCRDRVVRANICFVCDGHHPFVDGRPGRSGRAPWPSWRTECVQCKLYKCTHRQVLPWRDIQVVRCPSPPLWPSPVSVSDCDVEWSDLQPMG